VCPGAKNHSPSRMKKLELLAQRGTKKQKVNTPQNPIHWRQPVNCRRTKRKIKAPPGRDSLPGWEIKAGHERKKRRLANFPIPEGGTTKAAGLSPKKNTRPGRLWQTWGRVKEIHGGKGIRMGRVSKKERLGGLLPQRREGRRVTEVSQEEANKMSY